MRKRSVFSLSAAFFLIIITVSFGAVLARDLPLLKRSPSLKADLEAAMERTREAIIKKDYDGFIRSVALLDPEAKPPRSRWLEAVEHKLVSRLMLDKTFLDLKKSTRFIDLVAGGEWAVYYTEIRPEDPNYLSIGAVVFQKNDGKWLPVGMRYTYTKARPGSDAAHGGVDAWEGDEDLREAIKAMPEFQLEALVTAR